MSKGFLAAGCLIGTLMISPASRSADLPATNLIGCWREDHTATELADWDRQMAGPDAELLGMMPIRELCFYEGGTVVSFATGGFEGRDAGGHFTIDGDILTLRSDEPADAWFFGERSTTCRLSLLGNAMRLTGCASQGGASFSTGTFTREASP